LIFLLGLWLAASFFWEDDAGRGWQRALHPNATAGLLSVRSASGGHASGLGGARFMIGGGQELSILAVPC